MADIQISDDRARSFADALQTFEKDGDAAAFAAQFTSDAVTQRLDARGERRLGPVVGMELAQEPVQVAAARGGVQAEDPARVPRVAREEVDGEERRNDAERDAEELVGEVQPRAG